MNTYEKYEPHCLLKIDWIEGQTLSQKTCLKCKKLSECELGESIMGYGWAIRIGFSIILLAVLGWFLFEVLK